MLKKNFAAQAITAALLSTASLTAQAQVIDFDGLAGTDIPGGWNGLAYTLFVDGVSQLKGYTFATPGQYMYYAGADNAMIFCGGMYGHCASNGTDYLLANSILNVKRTDGASFNLHSLDLDNYYDGDADNPVQSSFRISATQAAGGTISTLVTLDSLPNTATSGTAAAFNHFVLSGFTNITSFEVEQLGARAWGGYGVDNVDVTAISSAVPEPSTWAMLCAGLTGLLLRRKPRSA